jgi:hypothetical protein
VPLFEVSDVCLTAGPAQAKTKGINKRSRV